MSSHQRQLEPGPGVHVWQCRRSRNILRSIHHGIRCFSRLSSTASAMEAAHATAKEIWRHGYFCWRIHVGPKSHFNEKVTITNEFIEMLALTLLG